MPARTERYQHRASCEKDGYIRNAAGSHEAYRESMKMSGRDPMGHM